MTSPQTLVPEIRFEGFSSAWEQRKLADVLSSYTDPVEIPHTGYERLGIRSHAKGTFHSYVPAGHELQTAQMHKVAADKFIVNITFGWEHAVAVTDENDAGKLVSHRFPQFSLSEELDPKFLKFIILDENFRHHLWLASPGGAGRNRVLNLTEMLQYEIHIPSVSEQRQIADVLIRLDNLITLHQRRYDQLKNVKKSMLEKMFPRNGANVPEIRFAGFTNAWEQRKLGEVAGVYDGVHQTPHYTDSGVMFLSVENITTLKSQKFISEEAFLRDYKTYPQQGDVLMTRIGDVGTPNVVETSEKLAFYVSLALLKPNGIDSYFLCNAIQSPRFQKGLKDRTLVTAIPQKINKDEIGKVDIFMPDSRVEQAQIGTYFRQLDHLITLHQCKCDKLKAIKNSLLQKMFV